MGPISEFFDRNQYYWDWPIFLSNLVGLALILFVLGKFALPPVKKLMRDRQETIRQQLVEADEAAAKAKEAETAHEQAVARGKSEAQEIRAGAKEDAKAITANIEADADREVARVEEGGRNRIDSHRSGLIRKIRGDVSLSALTGAGELVRSHLRDPKAQSDSIDQAIGELEAMADGSAASSEVPSTADLVGLHSMRAGSRDAALEVSRELDSVAGDKSADELIALADEIASLVAFLNANPVLRKKISDPADNGAGKDALLGKLFEGKVSATALQLLRTAGRGNWTSSADFITGVSRLSSVAVLTAAEKDGAGEQVEDELFRAERILAGQPELGSLLGDTSRPAAQRAELVDSIFGSKASRYTTALLRNTALTIAGQAYDLAVDQLVELSAARRDEAVARVIAASSVSAEQEQRLKAVLARVYGRPISVQVEIRPEVLGGLQVIVGDEVIRGDVASRLDKAREALPK